jgi:tetratricopeptide (TPR) repeat protein
VQQFVLELVPQDHLPPFFRDQARFPRNIGLGQAVLERFAAPVVRVSLEPKQARDLMLRGNYDEAIKQLLGEREQTTEQIRQARKLENNPEVGRRLEAWVQNALQKFAALFIAERENKAAVDSAKRDVDAIWKDQTAGDVITLLDGASARKRRPEATYSLALCKHERAEQAQGRLGAAGGPAPEWKEALVWWEKYTGEYFRDPEIWAARRQQGLVLAALGRTEEAIKVWEEGTPDDKRPLEKLEKVGCLYLAKQAGKK